MNLNPLGVMAVLTAIVGLLVLYYSEKNRNKKKKKKK